MNVLHTDFHRGWDGQPIYVFMVCEYLRRQGHEMLVAAPPGEFSRRCREAGIRVDDSFAFRPPASVVSFAADVRRMAALIREASIDILHANGSQDMWVGAAVRALTGKPKHFLATRHNTKPVRFNAANRYLYGRALDHLILASESVRERYQPFIKAGLLREQKISVVHSSYRTDMFHKEAQPERVREELGLRGCGPILGVVARLVIDKGHTYLFQAMEEIRRVHPGVVLLVAGSGTLEPALKAEAAARGLDGAVRFLGYRNDAADLTALFDVAILPSVGCDASSATIKEAMVLGRPIVATDVGGAREIIDDGVTGRVVKPADGGALASAILSILADPERARAMGERAREEVRRRFSPAVLGSGVLAVYESLNGAPKKAAAQRSAAASGGRGRRA